MDDILRVEELLKEYKLGDETIRAINYVSFHLERGEILAIMGSSGSGKSTILNVIGGLERPDSGKIYVNHVYEKKYSYEPFASEFRSRNIGYVFQTFNLLEDITVEENVELPLLLQKKDITYIKETVKEKLGMVGLYERRKSKPKELSGGQRQRVAIARAVIANPKILLADEPTGNLDYNTSTDIMNLLMKMNAELGQSIILVTHDPKVASYADRVIFLKNGKIINEYLNEEGKDNISEILKVFQQQYYL